MVSGTGNSSSALFLDTIVHITCCHIVRGVAIWLVDDAGRNLTLFAAIKIFSGALRGLGILFALLYFLAGYYAFATPVQTAIVLTHLLAIVLIVAGIIRMMKAFFWKPWAGWGGLLLSGFLTSLVGILIFLSPEAPFWLLGLLLALDLMFQGIHYLTLALYIQQRIPKSSADV